MPKKKQKVKDIEQENSNSYFVICKSEGGKRCYSTVLYEKGIVDFRSKYEDYMAVNYISQVLLSG